MATTEKKMYLPHFGQDLESKKTVAGILARAWFKHRTNQLLALRNAADRLGKSIAIATDTS